VKRIPDKGYELPPEGLVQSVLVIEIGDSDRVEGLIVIPGASRDGVHEQEGDKGHREKNRPQIEDAPEKIASHRLP
jgi:hypothetical protein